MTGRRSSLLASLAAALLTAGSAAAQPQQPTTALPPLALPNPPPAPAPGAAAEPPTVTADLRAPVPAGPPPALSGAFAQQGRGFSPPVPRFNFKIEANTPLKELLPAAPKVAPARGPLLTDDLTKVPEVEFAARPEAAPDKLTEQTAHQLAKITHANAQKRDAFMAALLESRPDLAGLPVAMGDDCRTGPEHANRFTSAVATVRQSMRNNGSGQTFWTNFNAVCDQLDATRSKSDQAAAEHITAARVAALTQMLAPESADHRTGLVKYLTAVPHVEATRALAKLAIFSQEDDIRAAAVEALRVRREKDYTDVLVKGLRYPLPAVAKRAADAIARIGRADLTDELVKVLDEADPRLPQKRDGATGQVVRELVRVNHHRNCMMCHAPGTTGIAPGSAVAAAVPIPGQPLPTPSQGYGQSSPDLMVRIDVTYLRQDFSASLAVADAHPWPELQRFDFLVRERTVSADEAAAFRDKLTPKEDGVLSPYHRAALAALRELTGKDTAPTAAAWRKLLKPASEE